MAIQWFLRKVCAEKNIWRSKDLQMLLEQKAGYKLTHKAVNDLLKGEPKQVRLTTLNALCTVLDCSPQDILVYTSDKKINLFELKEASNSSGSVKKTKISKPPV